MRNDIKDHGFLRPELDDSHYILGGLSLLPKDVLQTDGNWKPYIPSFEPQSVPTYDTNGCSCFGTLNALETLLKGLWRKL